MVEKKKNMINLFKGYSNYSDDEYKKIWDEALIVVDSNILLNFYRYSLDTRNNLFKILKKLKKRLWIPFQVGKEFFNNKNNVMVNSYNEYDSLIVSLNKKLQEAKEEVNKKKNNQLKCKKEINKILDNSIEQVEQLLKVEKSNKKPKFEKNEVEANIYDLFNDAIGEEIIGDEYEKMKREGLRRFDESIPPGYKDATKEENGDYYIFYSLMKKAKLEDKDIIFITDDVKEDWFNRINGEVHGGRYELLNEFFKETGKLLMIYTSDGFVESYGKNLGKDLANEETISELKTVRNIRIKEVGSDNLIVREYIEKLKYYRDNISDNDDNEEILELFNSLRFVIRRLNISFEEAEKLFNEMRILRRRMYVGYDGDRLKKFIDRVINCYNYSFDAETNNLFLKKCYEYLLLLERAETRFQRMKIYDRLIEITKEQLLYLHLKNVKDNYLLLDKMSLFLDKLEMAVNERKFDDKDVIIEKVREIIEMHKGLECK